MTTQRFYICTECDTRRDLNDLFEALRRESEDNAPRCEHCGQPNELRLVFSFELGAGSRTCKVLDAFLPHNPPTWKKQNGKDVTFWPILVAVEYIGDQPGRGFWLPYWNIEDGTAKKHGQWAPFMDGEVFEDLLIQARKKGYLTGMADRA